MDLQNPEKAAKELSALVARVGAAERLIADQNTKIVHLEGRVQVLEGKK